MDLAGYVINAVLVEGRSVKEVCESHDISRSWLYELIARYRELRVSRHNTVEVAGIEPASFGFSTGLLRAQPVEDLGPVVVTGTRRWAPVS